MAHRLHPRILVSFLLMIVCSGGVAAFPRDETVSGSVPAALALIQSDDGASGDLFGKAVAIDGDLMAVGASAADVGTVNSNGAVYLYARDTTAASGWTQRTKIVPPTPEVGQSFGFSVALQDDTLAVGATATNSNGVSDAGAVYVYERDRGDTDSWGLAKTLTEAVGTFASYGSDLALDNGLLLVGALGADRQKGAAFLYDGSADWARIKDFRDSEGVIADYFGTSVALDGDTLVIGQPMGTFNARDDSGGRVFIYERNQGGANQWGETRRLVASTPEDGSTFGNDLVLDGSTLVVGAPNADSAITPAIVDTGAAFVFERDRGGAGQWGVVTRLAATDGAQGDKYGSALALEGDALWIGAPFYGAGTAVNNGQVYRYGRDVGGSDAWGETPPLAPDDVFGSRFGSALAVSDTTLAVSALGVESDRGAVFVPAADEPQPPTTSQVYLPMVSAIHWTPTGTLQNGGSVATLSGARVGVVAGTLSEDVGILLEPVSSSPTSLGENVQAVGGYYALAAQRRIATTADKRILVGLPVPDGADTDNMALAMLISANSTVEEGDSTRWIAVPGRLDPESGLFVATIGSLASDIITIVLIEHPALDPVPVADGANGASRPAQSNRFFVLCEPFTTSLSCSLENRDLLASELNLAYDEFVGEFGFDEPQLPRAAGVFTGPNGDAVLLPGLTYVGVFLESPPCLTPKFAEYDGLFYFRAATMHICFRASTSAEDVRHVARHELFHAIQASYPAMYRDAFAPFREHADWTIEGTAAAAERSNTTMVSSTRHNAHTISDRLIDRTDDHEYQAGDFWVYYGREAGEGLDFLRVVFESGGTPENVKSALDLEESYWKWAKNQAFEKNIRIHPDLDEPVCAPETDLTGTHTVRTWNRTGTTTVGDTLTPLTSDVIEFQFEQIMEIGTISLTSSGGDDVRYKVYIDDGRTDCADDPDGEVSLGVGAGITVYVLVSNADPEQTYTYSLNLTGAR